MEAPPPPPPAFAQVAPRPAAIAAARRFARTRRGVVAFAVVDTRGRLRGGLHSHRELRAASVTKAMLLVDRLRDPAPLDAATRERLTTMILRSGNRAAAEAYALAGRDAALRRVGRAAGMRSLVLRGGWSEAGITAADQARFFWRLDRLVPRGRRAFAARLLETTIEERRWGAPRAAHRRMAVRAKAGWRQRLVHQVALVTDARGRRVAIAVLTDGNPGARSGDHAAPYGAWTVQGVARRLLAAPGG